eukprot:gb/GEZN01006419.1/.p1 GENE.gb/GEZN01006419.1/~~gb/GEZN01006419.1/.p1  ORF type:complete len:396 (-),score=24.39 gb/GEZN01006419.1/:321-1508(-)
MTDLSPKKQHWAVKPKPQIHWRVKESPQNNYDNVTIHVPQKKNDNVTIHVQSPREAAKVCDVRLTNSTFTEVMQLLEHTDDTTDTDHEFEISHGEKQSPIRQQKPHELLSSLLTPSSPESNVGSSPSLSRSTSCVSLSIDSLSPSPSISPINSPPASPSSSFRSIGPLSTSVHSSPSARTVQSSPFSFSRRPSPFKFPTPLRSSLRPFRTKRTTAKRSITSFSPPSQSLAPFSSPRAPCHSPAGPVSPSPPINNDSVSSSFSPLVTSFRSAASHVSSPARPSRLTDSRRLSPVRPNSCRSSQAPPHLSRPRSPSSCYVFISDIVPGSLSDKAGLMTGDYITHVNGILVNDALQVTRYLSAASRHTLTILRNEIILELGLDFAGVVPQATVVVGDS